MKYEAKDFEQMKNHVEKFMKKGPMGDIYLYFFLKPFPYNPTKNTLDTLAYADVRKMLIDFLKGVSQSCDADGRNQTKQLIQEIQEYGYPDQRGEDDMKDLAWKLCDMIKSVDYEEWESRRQIGESEADVVRRTYQQMRIPEYCIEQLEFWQKYAGCKHLKYEKEIQVVDIIVELQDMLNLLPKSEWTKEKLMLTSKRLLDVFNYNNCTLHYVLENVLNGRSVYNGVAESGSDVVYFSPDERMSSSKGRKYTSVDVDLLADLEIGYEISFMTMDGHLTVWNELGNSDVSVIKNKKGLAEYLHYCKENDITAYTINETMGCMPPDLFEIMEQQKKGQIFRNVEHQEDKIEIHFKDGKELVQWQNQSLGFQLSEKEASIILGYLEGNGYSLEAKEKQLYLCDDVNMEKSNTDMVEVIDKVRDLNYALLQETIYKIDMAEIHEDIQEDEIRLSDMQADEKILDKVEERLIDTRPSPHLNRGAR